jgi:hypothetical protein
MESAGADASYLVWYAPCEDTQPPLEKLSEKERDGGGRNEVKEHDGRRGSDP